MQAVSGEYLVSYIRRAELCPEIFKLNPVSLPAMPCVKLSPRRDVVYSLPPGGSKAWRTCLNLLSAFN